MSLNDLVSNRTDFKLAVCDIHLKRLKEIEEDTGALSSAVGIGESEKELDEFLYQIMTVKDSLLQEINEKVLGLKIPIKKVTLTTVNIELARCCKSYITNDINQICKHWLSLLNEFHNHSKHRKMISREIIGIINENLNQGTTTSSIRTKLIDPRTDKAHEEDAIPYLENRLTEMKTLVSDTRSLY